MTLSGVTAQGTTIELGVEKQHVVWLRTSLNARCAGGSNWHEGWSPMEGDPVHFSTTGHSFVTAQHVSPSYSGGIVGRIEFAIRGTLNRVDGVCVTTYDEMSHAQAQAAQEYSHFDDHVLLDSAYYVLSHAWQLHNLVSFGQPPQARGLYDAWLANFRHRVSVERQAVVLYAHNDRVAAQRDLASLNALKAQGNLLGERFGLVRCTSNGARTPIPILSDGQPLPLP